MLQTTNGTKRKKAQGFSLIELLTVIAIIAILTAIIFPVFATVRENARQSTSMSNMHDISAKLEQYRLDNHKYPDVLFGYVYHQHGDNTLPVVPMDQALAQSQADFAAGLGVAVGTTRSTDPTLYFPGLYPEYMTNPNEFTDPNNDLYKGNLAANTGAVYVNILDSSGNLTSSNTQTPTNVVPDFYIADSYDISPEIDGSTTNKLVSSPTVYVPRYQPSWTKINNTYDCEASPSSGAAMGLCNGSAPVRNDYRRQLRWKNPPPETYMTCTTYHVPIANTVLVLWQGGNVKKMPVSVFLATSGGADAANISVNVNGVSGANFWKAMPTASGQ